MTRFNSMWEWYSKTGRYNPPYAAVIALHGGCLIRQRGQPDRSFRLLDEARRDLQIGGWKMIRMVGQ